MSVPLEEYTTPLPFPWKTNSNVSYEETLSTAYNQGSDTIVSEWISQAQSVPRSAGCRRWMLPALKQEMDSSLNELDRARYTIGNLATVQETVRDSIRNLRRLGDTSRHYPEMCVVADWVSETSEYDNVVRKVSAMTTTKSAYKEGEAAILKEIKSVEQQVSQTPGFVASIGYIKSLYGRDTASCLIELQRVYESGADLATIQKTAAEQLEKVKQLGARMVSQAELLDLGDGDLDVPITTFEEFGD